MLVHGKNKTSSTYNRHTNQLARVTIVTEREHTVIRKEKNVLRVILSILPLAAITEGRGVTRIPIDEYMVVSGGIEVGLTWTRVGVITVSR